MTDAIKRALRRRSAVEPVIGRLKDDHRMDRIYLVGHERHAANAILAVLGHNFRLLIVWLEALLSALMATALGGRPMSQKTPPFTDDDLVSRIGALQTPEAG